MLGIVLTPYGQIPGTPPWGINYSYGGDGTYLCPYDPQYNTRGEPGFYHDTRLGGLRENPAQQSWVTKRLNRRIRKALRGAGLGDAPTDAELWATYGYVPMINGWVVAKEGYQSGGWYPPNDGSGGGAFEPSLLPMAMAATANSPYALSGLRGLRDASTTNTELSPTDAAAMSDLVDEVEQHNNNILILTVLSTAAVVISAIFTTVRNARLIQQEKALFENEALTEG